MWHCPVEIGGQRFVITANEDNNGSEYQPPFSPPAAPVQGRLQGPPAKSKFLAVLGAE